MKQSLYILPFDHRNTFREIVKAKDHSDWKDVQIIKEYKKMIYFAFKQANISRNKAGILVDETYGREILLDAKKQGLIFCYTLEKSGQNEFFFDKKDYKKRLEFFKPTYAKVLVRYNPEGNKSLNHRQAKRLAQLNAYLKKKKIGFLFELLEIPTEIQLKKEGSQNVFDHQLRAGLMVKAIRELQKEGLDPDIWKLEGLQDKKSMEAVAKEVLNFNPKARIIVLGRGENEKKAEFWIRTAAKVKGVIGFAVGRTVFKQPLLDYRNKKINKQEAINKIAKNYLHFVKIFEKARGSQ